jgi:macrolide transport system ATP-binding/permease protein
LDGIARLKEGVSIQTALAELRLIASALERQYPDSNRGQSASVERLSAIVVGPLRSVLLMLMSGATLLFVIALVNIISLLLVRSESRRQEMAVRRSLGASRRRIAMQFFTEGFLLIVAAALVGLGCAEVAGQLLLKLIPADMMARTPYLQGIGLNLHVLAFVSLITFISAAVFGLSPLLVMPKGEPNADLAKGARWSAGLAWRRFGSKLVVIEFATALVLLISAGLLAKSFYRLLHVDVGFVPDHLAAITVAASDADYGKDEQRIALGRKIIAEIGALPGVTGVAMTSALPVTCNCNTDWIRVVGKPFDGRHQDVLERDVSPGYFRTLQVKLLRGRYFTERDDKSQPNVIIVNQAFARKYFPGEDPIGRQIGDLKLSPQSLRCIVGVVDDMREGSLEDDVWPSEYSPFNQGPDTYFHVVARTQQDEHAILPQLRSVIRRTDPGLGTSDETSISDRITRSPAAYLHRSSAWLVGSFAALALILSVVGLYGVVTYSVAQRTREIGVRIALGAETQAVYALVLKEAGGLIAAGIAGGVVASLAISKALQQLLFGVQPWDPTTLAGVSMLLATAALLASFAPAERAAHVNPLDVLRAE